MNFQEEKERVLRSYPQGDLESPFLNEELFAEEPEAEWEAQLARIETESPFLSAFEGWPVAQEERVNAQEEQETDELRKRTDDELHEFEISAAQRKKLEKERRRAGWKETNIQFIIEDFRGKPMQHYLIMSRIIDAKTGETVFLGWHNNKWNSTSTRNTGVVVYPKTLVPLAGALVLDAFPILLREGREEFKGEFLGNHLSGSSPWQRRHLDMVLRVFQKSEEITIRSRTRAEVEDKLKSEGKVGFVVGTVSLKGGVGSEGSTVKGKEAEIEYKVKLALPSLRIEPVMSHELKEEESIPGDLGDSEEEELPETEAYNTTEEQPLTLEEDEFALDSEDDEEAELRQAGGTTAFVPAKASSLEETVGRYVIYFEKDKDIISLSQEKGKLAQVAVALQDPYSHAYIVGHTSKEGDPGYNDELSRRRARSVIYFLKKLGVASEKMKSAWRGENEPAIPDNGDEQKRALNRRVEIEIGRKLPTSSLGRWQKFAENALTKHRQGIRKLTKQIEEFEKYAVQAKTKRDGGGFADWQLMVDMCITRREWYDKNLRALEKAIVTGVDEIREWGRQRQAEIEDKNRYVRLTLAIVERRLVEAKAELERAKSDQKTFWKDVVDYYERKRSEAVERISQQ